jgi:asparagine synthetase B (glutamine-hydrolysing)
MSDQDLAAAFVVLIKLKKRKRRWSKEWFKKRQKYTHEHLLRDLALTEVNDFKNFVRLDLAKFQELLDLTTPLIEKKNTNMREAIPRLSITLRYLATGNSLEDLKFSIAISPQSLSLIIMETCDAIIQVLRHLIKTNIQLSFVAC